MTNKTLIDTLEYCDPKSMVHILILSPDGTVLTPPINSVSYINQDGEVHLCVSELTNDQITRLNSRLLELRSGRKNTPNQ